jgi:hypothetical protein
MEIEMTKGTYTVEVYPTTVFTTAGRMGDFFVGVLIHTAQDGTRECALRSSLYAEERTARLQAALYREGYESYLARTGKRWEVEQAEKRAEEKIEKEMPLLRKRRRVEHVDAMAELLAEAHTALNWQGAEYLAKRVKSLLGRIEISDADREQVKAEALEQAAKRRRVDVRQGG